MSSVTDGQKSEETIRSNPNRNSRHSLDELLKIVSDMGDEKVIEAVKKKIDEQK